MQFTETFEKKNDEVIKYKQQISAKIKKKLKTEREL